MNKDYMWIMKHFEELVTKYAGDYVAVVEEKVVASDRSGGKVREEALRKHPDKSPFVFPVPRREDLNCLL